MKNEPSRSALADHQAKRRPSIEMAPSLERPVYIITRNMNGHHILALTDQLDKHKISYQMQQETATLGFKFNQRFFVIVDNKIGEVTLGPEFGSILMTVVGYPKVGKNKKNRYCEKPKDVVQFFEKFKADADISERQKSLINSQYSDIVLENGNGSKVTSKIAMRSISKYKAAEKIEGQSQNSSKEKVNKQFQRVKLLIISDPSDEPYHALCLNLMQTMNTRQRMQMTEINQVMNKSMFHTKEVGIYYLVNQKHKRELINSITIGEIVVFRGKQEIGGFKSIMKEMKIYAICYERIEAVKILEKIGVASTISQLSILPNKDEEKVSGRFRERGDDGINESGINIIQESSLGQSNSREDYALRQPASHLKEQPVLRQQSQGHFKEETLQNKPGGLNQEESALGASMINNNNNNSIIVTPVKQESVHNAKGTGGYIPAEAEHLKEGKAIIQVSKIEGLESFTSRNSPNSNIGSSILSQSSKNKVKRLKLGKSKKPVPKQLTSEYFPTKKQNQVPSASGSQIRNPARKKTMGMAEQKPVKLKKSLKFIDRIEKEPCPSRIRKIHSVDKCQPETVTICSATISTMTEQEYFPERIPSKLASAVAVERRSQKRATAVVESRVGSRNPKRQSTQITVTNQAFFEDAKQNGSIIVHQENNAIRESHEAPIAYDDKRRNSQGLMNTGKSSRGLLNSFKEGSVYQNSGSFIQTVGGKGIPERDRNSGQNIPHQDVQKDATSSHKQRAYSTNTNMYKEIDRVIQKDLNSRVHAVFYREFIPQFHNIVQLMKMNPSGLFTGDTQVYQPFFNPKEFDRSAKKIKQKLWAKNRGINQFNFIIFLLKEEMDAFQKYCEQKNSGYSEQKTDFDCTFQAGWSSSGTAQRINIFMFCQTEISTQQPVIVDYDRIKIFRYGLAVNRDLTSKIISEIKTRVLDAKKLAS